MRSVYALGALLPLVLACDNPENDACAGYLSKNAAVATAFCGTYTQSANTVETGLPAWATACGNRPKKISSACSCQVGAATAVAPVATETSAVKISAPTSGLSSFVTMTRSSVASSVAPTASVKSSAAIVSPVVSKSAVVASSVAPVAASPVVSSAAVTGGASVSLAVGGTTCTVTEYAGIASAVASCTNILLSDIAAPASSTIDLSALQTGTSVIFAGETTFGTTEDSDFDPMVISGTNIVVSGADGHVIDGNGPAYWDGQGSNGGTDKPDHFIVAKKLNNARFENLNIQNWPTHCFYVSGSESVTFSNILLNNTAGDAPNSASGKKAAAHNSDGFDISSSDNVLLTDSSVYNQDDCVAVTSGSKITVNNMHCSGGHGLSIGSIGGKSNNTVADVTFQHSTIVNSQNGCRIKSNSGTTGSISNIVYNNITMSGISDYGIDVQQDYLNGGATGKPTNGVTIAGVSFTDVTGTMTDGQDYYILCGSGSCSDFSFKGVSITGGSGDSCNYPTNTCPS